MFFYRIRTLIIEKHLKEKFTLITLRKVRVKIHVDSWLKKQIEGLHLRTANHELSQIHTNYSLRYAFVKIRVNPWLKKNTVAIVVIRGNPCG